MEDLEIIHTYLDTQASRCFSLLYDRYAGKVYSKCISLLLDEALAQDATQEIFTRIFLRLGSFRENAKFSTWVYSITYNFCIDLLRRRKKTNKLFMDSENIPDVADEIPDEALYQMEADRLRYVLNNIPLEDKAVLLMKYQDDLTIKEIADIFDKSESAIKMKIKRAKERAVRIREEQTVK